MGTLFVALVNEDKVLELLDADIPGIGGAGRAHNGCSCLICHEDVCFLFTSDLLNVLIVKDGRLLPCALKTREALGSGNTASTPGCVELMELTGLKRNAEVSRCHVKKLVVVLLAELSNSRPLWLDLVTSLSETASLVWSIVATGVSSVLCALCFFDPLGAFLGHLWALHLNLVGGFFLLKFGAQLVFVDLGAKVLLLTASIVTLLVITHLLLFNNVELGVLLRLNKVALSDGTRLLVLLHQGLPVRDKCSGLHGGKVAQFAETVFFAVRLKELTVELLCEVELLIDRTEASGLEVETKVIEVEIGAADLFNHILCIF